MEKEEFLRLLPKLIREDDEVKGAIITALSGVVATKEDIRQVINEFDKRFEASDKRFDAMQKDMDKRFDESNKRFDESNKRFEAMQKQMSLGFSEVNKRIDTLDKKVETIDKKVSTIDIAIGALGNRSGKSLEKSILNVLKDKLIQENIQSSEIKKVYLTDSEGLVFSKNATTDVDVVIEDGKTILVEIKYRPDQDGIEKFLNIAKLYKKIKKPYDKLLIIALEIKRKHYDYANQKGINVISGKIIEKK